MKYYSLSEAEEFLDGKVKASTLKKYVQANLVDHYRVGFMKPGSTSDKRTIVFTEDQLNRLMQKFLVKTDNSEKNAIDTLFPKPKKGAKNGRR